jgi:hypothetical protein
LVWTTNLKKKGLVEQDVTGTNIHRHSCRHSNGTSHGNKDAKGTKSDPEAVALLRQLSQGMPCHEDEIATRALF